MKILYFSMTLIFLCSCYSNKELQKSPADNNATYEIAYLFTHEGCKVYRFQDCGNYVYFTNCDGKVEVRRDSSSQNVIQNLIRANSKY